MGLPIRFHGFGKSYERAHGMHCGSRETSHRNALYLVMGIHGLFHAKQRIPCMGFSMGFPTGSAVRDPLGFHRIPMGCIVILIGLPVRRHMGCIVLPIGRSTGLVTFRETSPLGISHGKAQGKPVGKPREGPWDFP